MSKFGQFFLILVFLPTVYYVGLLPFCGWKMRKCTVVIRIPSFSPSHSHALSYSRRTGQ